MLLRTMNPHLPPAHFAKNTDTESSRTILVVLHQQSSSPGRIGRMLRLAGMNLDIRLPRYGDPLPAGLADYAGAIVFGGPRD